MLPAFSTPPGTEVWAYAYNPPKTIVKPIRGILSSERYAVHTAPHEYSKYFVPYRGNSTTPMWNRCVRAMNRRFAETYADAVREFNELVRLRISYCEAGVRSAKAQLIPEDNLYANGILDTGTKMRLCTELIELLSSWELWSGDIAIYLDDKRLTPDKPSETEQQKYGQYYHAATAGKNVGYYIVSGVQPTPNSFNPDTLTVTFENELYEFMNYNTPSGVVNDMNELFKKYGLYLEQDEAWNFSLYSDK